MFTQECGMLEECQGSTKKYADGGTSKHWAISGSNMSLVRAINYFWTLRKRTSEIRNLNKFNTKLFVLVKKFTSQVKKVPFKVNFLTSEVNFLTKKANVNFFA